MDFSNLAPIGTAIIAVVLFGLLVIYGASSILFSLVNFVGIMCLYAMSIYMYGSTISIADDVQDLKTQFTIQQNQLVNLVDSINDNNQYLVKQIKERT